MDILLAESNNDINIVNGEFQLTTLNSQELRQRILLRLNTFRGEWTLNPTFGIPYRQTLFQRVRNKEQVDAIFLNEVTSTPGVNSISDFFSEYNRATRQYTIVRMVVETTEGTQVRFTQDNPDNTIYPAPPQSLTFICEI